MDATINKKSEVISDYYNFVKYIPVVSENRILERHETTTRVYQRLAMPMLYADRHYIWGRQWPSWRNGITHAAGQIIEIKKVLICALLWPGFAFFENLLNQRVNLMYSGKCNLMSGSNFGTKLIQYTPQIHTGCSLLIRLSAVPRMEQDWRREIRFWTCQGTSKKPHWKFLGESETICFACGTPDPGPIWILRSTGPAGFHL